jgi:lysophospholipase L1-like esterase
MRLSRLRALTLAALAATGLAVTGESAATATTTPSIHYYVALGDSLSVGYQPGLGNTPRGYTDDLYAALKAKDPSLQLVKLGCAGETTTTMLKGGRCATYPEGSQIKAAEAFLHTHRGQVKLVTLDIGANDVDGCLTGGNISPSCILQGIGTITMNLPQLTARLRLAGGFAPHYTGMNYYDPFLASWLKGSSGQSLARESVLLADIINAMETGVYRVSGFAVADVAGAFATNDFGNPEKLPNGVTVPRNVARVCNWTWMCKVGDIHANDVGYQHLADAFAAVVKTG